MSIDTYLGIAGFVLGLLGLISGYIFYRMGLRMKDPCYDIKNNNLINGYSILFSDLAIKYKKKKIENLTVSKIVFWNNGNETINRFDVVEDFPVVVIAQEGVEILDIKILEANNSTNNFSAQILPSNKFARIDFDYLDSKDGAIIQVIHTGKGDYADIRLAGKIKGVETIKFRVTSKRDWTKTVVLIVGLIYLLFFMIIGIYENFILSTSNSPQKIMNYILLILGPVGLYFFMKNFLDEYKMRANLPKELKSFHEL